VSALGHFLEEEGLATTIISLIRVHSEKVKAPRNLWVPFELGRPLGAPDDPEQQKRVLRAALDLLERDGGPSIIEDFEDEGDYQAQDAGWKNPAADIAVDVDPTDLGAARAAIHAEITALKPLYEQAVSESGRDPVGTSGLTIEKAVDHITAFLGEPPESPREDLSAAMLMRYAADDLKTFYLLSVAAGPGHPASVQLTDWFWQETAAARVLIALRAMWKDSEDKSVKTVCGSFLVPHVQVVGLGL
jgi:hypothetical protein